MLDVKMMRQNIEEVQEKLMTRGVKKETLAEFMELDENRRKLLVKSEELKKYPESKVYLSTPPVIPGLGSSGGFEMVLEARGNASYGDLQRAVDTLLHYASKRKELTGLSSSMQSDIPQLYFDVDRDKAQMLGVPMADIFSTSMTSICSTASTASISRPKPRTGRSGKTSGCSSSGAPTRR